MRSNIFRKKMENFENDSRKTQKKLELLWNFFKKIAKFIYFLKKLKENAFNPQTFNSSKEQNLGTVHRMYNKTTEKNQKSIA